MNTSRGLWRLLLIVTGLGLTLWAFGALWFDAAPAAAWGFAPANQPGP